MTTFQRYVAEVNAEQVERRELTGQEWLVAPVVLVKEMVLNGGFAPFEEIAQSAPGWNGRPFTLYHPQADDGSYQMANTPDVLANATLGRVFDVEVDEDLRGLTGQVWTHLGATEAIGGEAAEAVQQIQNEEDTLEVSTGYWMNPQPEAGTHEGDTYEQIQTDIMPDHLAALPNSEGKCSVEDGCGVPATAAAANDAATPAAVTNGARAAQCGCTGDGAASQGLSLSAVATDLTAKTDLSPATVASVLRRHTDHRNMTDKIQFLAENTEFSADELADMDEDMVDRIHDSVQAARNDAQDDGPTDGGDGTDDGQDGAQNAVDADQLAEQVAGQVLNQVDERLEQFKREQQAERRDELIDTITNASDQWDEDELVELNVSMLEKLADQTAAATGHQAQGHGGGQLGGINYARPAATGQPSENDEYDGDYLPNTLGVQVEDE